MLCDIQYTVRQPNFSSNDWSVLGEKPIQSLKIAISEVKTANFCPHFTDKVFDDFPDFSQKNYP